MTASPSAQFGMDERERRVAQSLHSGEMEGLH
jgi:hypothetical protein